MVGKGHGRGKRALPKPKVPAKRRRRRRRRRRRIVESDDSSDADDSDWTTIHWLNGFTVVLHCSCTSGCWFRWLETDSSVVVAASVGSILCAWHCYHLPTFVLLVCSCLEYSAVTSCWFLAFSLVHTFIVCSFYHLHFLNSVMLRFRAYLPAICYVYMDTVTLRQYCNFCLRSCTLIHHVHEDGFCFLKL